MGCPAAPKTCCGKDIVTEGGICTHCPYAPPEFQSHPDPAVAQLQRAVKQAGERLAELEQIHADGTPPEGSVGHDFLCDRLDAIEKRLATLENVAGETPRELRDRLTRHVSNSNHWLCTVEERVTALEDNAHTPNPDFPPIATQEQVAAAYADRYATGTAARKTCLICGEDISGHLGVKSHCVRCIESHTAAELDASKLAVAPSLKQRFSDWIDARTAQGIETYGGPLQTDNGRDAERDAFQELLDFCQYQEQSRQEILAANAVLRERVDFAKKLLGLRSLPNKD